MEQLLNKFEEFLDIYKFINRQKIADMLIKELSTSEHIKVYEMTDGTYSSREIASAVGTISYGTVLQWWKKWAFLGILKPVEKSGRYKGVFNLSDYGLNVNDKGEK